MVFFGALKDGRHQIPRVIFQQRTQLLTQILTMKYSWNKSFNSIHLHGLSAQRVLEKDTVSAFKDFDNSVRMIETCPRNYNAKQNVKNSTADPQNERWNSAVWCSGFGVTQAGDGAHL